MKTKLTRFSVDSNWDDFTFNINIQVNVTRDEYFKYHVQGTTIQKIIDDLQNGKIFIAVPNKINTI